MAAYCSINETKFHVIAVNGDLFNWTEACIQREEKYHLWSSNASNMDYYRFTEGFFAPVDAVHLMHVSISSWCLFEGCSR